MKKTGRTVTGIILAGIIVLGLYAPRAAAGAGRDIRLTVRVFRVPRTQDFDAAWPDGRGGTLDLQVHGNVTASFPRATVFFETELAANASDSAIARAILERVAFESGGLAMKRLRIDELKSLELVLGPSGPKAEARFEESQGEGRSSNYAVLAELLSSEGIRPVIRLRFDAGWSAQGGRLGVGMSEDVISSPFELTGPNLLLIGATSSASGGAFPGTVYWLAVSAAGGPADRR